MTSRAARCTAFPDSDGRSVRDGVAHLRVKIPGAFKPFAQRTAPFLQQVLVHRAFLVDRHQFAKRSRRTLSRPSTATRTSSPAYKVNSSGTRLRMRIIRTAMNGDSRAKIVLSGQPFSGPVGRAIQPLGSYFRTRAEFHLAAKFRVRKLRLVLNRNGADPRSRTRSHSHQDVHLERVRMRRRNDNRAWPDTARHLRASGWSRSSASFMSLSRNGSPTFSRRAESASASPGGSCNPSICYPVDIEVLTDNEIQAHAAGNVRQFRAHIRVAAGVKQFSQARAFRFC